MANTQVTTRDTQLEKQRIGLLQLTLTNFANTSEPAIAAGSVVEFGGSLYVFSGDEAITGWSGVSNDTDAYIKLVPGVSLVTAEFVEAAPTWSDSKQGWYNGNDRYVAGLHRGVSAAEYEDKWVYQRSQDKTDDHRFFGTGIVEFDSGIAGDLTGGIEETGSNSEVLKVKVFELGDWNMVSTAIIEVTHGLGSGFAQKVRSVDVIIRHNTNGQTYSLLHQAGTPDDIIGGAIGVIDDTTIDVWRTTTGFFDTSSFDSTSFNRGWLTVWYEA